MSAFNNARYNLSEFNRTSESVIWISSSLSEKVNFVAATSATRYSQFEGNENVLSDIVGAKGLIKPAESAEEKITGQGTAFSFFKFAFEENIITDNSFDVSLSAFLYFDMYEKTDCLVLESACNWLHLDMAEDVIPSENGLLPWSQFVYADIEGTEVADGNIFVEAYDEYICDLSGITLKPGDTLVIDAGNYDVLWNKKNAIHYQTGDWLDELNRSTRMIKIIADYPSHLSATILFTERYL